MLAALAALVLSIAGASIGFTSLLRRQPVYYRLDAAHRLEMLPLAGVLTLLSLLLPVHPFVSALLALALPGLVFADIRLRRAPNELNTMVWTAALLGATTTGDYAAMILGLIVGAALLGASFLTNKLGMGDVKLIPSLAIILAGMTPEVFPNEPWWLSVAAGGLTVCAWIVTSCLMFFALNPLRKSSQNLAFVPALTIGFFTTAALLPVLAI